MANNSAIQATTQVHRGDSARGDAVAGDLDNSPLIRAMCVVIGWDWRRLAVAAVLVIGLAVARAPFTQVSDALFVSDGFGYYIWLPSLVIDHDLDLSNQLARLPYEGEKHFFTVSKETGMARNQFPVGCAIFWAPFFIATDVAVMGLNALGMEIVRDGFGWAYELPVYLGSFVYGLLAIWLVQRILRQLFSPRIADLALFVAVFATPLAFYVWLEPNMSHTVAAFVISLWIFLLLQVDSRGDQRLSRWALLGIVLGAVALIRPYNGILGVVAIPVALRVCAVANKPWAARLGPALLRLSICAGVSLVMLIPQLYVWQVLYGAPFVVPDSSGYQAMAWTSPEAARYLSSVFLFSPVYVFSFAGLLSCWSAQRASPTATDRTSFAQRTAPLALFVLALISYLVAASRDWDLGTAFGQRRLCDWVIFIAIGLALLLQRPAICRRPRVVAGVALLLVGVNSLLAVLYLLKYLPEYGITV